MIRCPAIGCLTRIHLPRIVCERHQIAAADLGFDILELPLRKLIDLLADAEEKPRPALGGPL